MWEKDSLTNLDHLPTQGVREYFGGYSGIESSKEHGGQLRLVSGAQTSLRGKRTVGSLLETSRL